MSTDEEFLMCTEWNSICFTYLTVPEDISTQMIVNFQSFSQQPTSARVIIQDLAKTLNQTGKIFTFFKAYALKYLRNSTRWNIIQKKRDTSVGQS